MDKNAIKKYAVWARRELIDRVTKRAAVFGVTKDDFGDPNADSVNGHLLFEAEKRQRQALIRRIEEKGYEQVMEEVAYTWFNRFAALRFMEVNGYLPSHIRVLTDDEGRFRPQILSEAIHMELDGLNTEKVYQLKDGNQEEELFKYLLIVQCNALNGILPGMFQKIEDYTELLLPDYLLREGSVIEQMIALIPEDDWKDHVQIIGWLYQYYNTEPKDNVFADLKKNIKISKEHIPAATQLFTPDWIVHYMVENSLGRLWLEGHPSARDKYLPAHNEDGSVCVEEGKWNYYLEEAEQEPAVQAQLTEIRKQYAALKPEEILTIDPCAGSGHILCVLFDVLVQIYEDYGYTAREAAVSIVQNNLWGLDIDDRAAQLAYFAVMMKARQYDRRFFTREVQPHVYAIQESNGIHRDHLNYLGHGLSDIERNNALNQMNALLDEFIDAKEYGSILQPSAYDWALLSRFVEDTTPDQQVSFGEAGLENTQAQLRLMIAQGQALAQKYHAVVTNPPYVGRKGMGAWLSDYLDSNFPNGKMDTFATFILRCRNATIHNGSYALMTPFVWTTLSSYEELRNEILNTGAITSYLQPEENSFRDAAVSICAFSVLNTRGCNFTGKYIKLSEYPDIEQQYKEVERIAAGISTEYLHIAQMAKYRLLPESKYLYWASSRVVEIFSDMPVLGSVCATRQGMATTNNDLFLRLWFEVVPTRVRYDCTSQEDALASGKKWFPFNKGGGFRKWYGNNEYLVNFENNGQTICDYIDNTPGARVKSNGRVINRQYYFLPCITWSDICGRTFAARDCDKGFIFSIKGSSGFASEELHYYVLALMNSYISVTILNMINPSITTNVGDVKQIPFALGDDEQVSRVKERAVQNVLICRNDWDSFETSWDFQRHPLATPAVDRHSMRLSDCWRDWERACAERFAQLKANEEELNRIFIDIYGLQDELTPDVDDKDVTVRKADLGRDVHSLISYAVGCMLGRYSLDKPGLAFAGGAWDARQYVTYPADKDGILPITDDEYFSDDIVTMFVDWVKTVYGAATLEENLRFIADALGGKGSPREVIRNYFLNDFYKDHLKIYQKRPIYWLFDSGKKNGFKALIYMHRYQPDAIARVRTDYVHEMQSRYRTAIADVEQRMNGASTSERVKLTKRLTALQAQADELRLYEEKVHHLADQMIAIDLDDGVKVNYAKFADVLAPIK